VLGFGGDGSADLDASAITEAIDLSLLDRLADLIDEATTAFEAFDYARALERTEAFFWAFTDDHVELVKQRAYGERGDDGAASARAALRLALSSIQRLFAPFLPFVTEEVWSWWQDGSIHTASWPDSAELRAVAAGAGHAPSEVAAEALGVVRRVKSENKRKLRTTVTSATFTGPGAKIAVLDRVIDDVKAAGVIAAVTDHVTSTDGNEISVAAELEPEPPTD
jgi:valyl-tRNA synthetase